MKIQQKQILLVGGFDPSQGAGLATDLRVARAFKVPARPIVTTLAIQSDRSFLRLVNLSSDKISAQLEAFEGDRIAVIKIGALGSLKPWKNILPTLLRFRVPIVLDPVYQTSSGGKLTDGSARTIRKFYWEHLLPACTVVTPNYPEACFFLGEAPRREIPPEILVSRLSEQLPCAVLVKGGHWHGGSVIDMLSIDGVQFFFRHPRTKKTRVRGSGCALATALACSLIQEKDIPLATQAAIHRVAGWIGSAARVRQEMYHLLQP